ncbi:ATP-binding protein [Streptomyces platensis]|uniref:ATP-binding protein n=1 Tax=Streptomyces platensis TaxID=58346 RepID=UPI002E7FCF0B|nr:ATP-binding protein [Streptomyces platensis]WUB78631.1 ATP-binding protein [Streptomyces platensis]
MIDSHPNPAEVVLHEDVLDYTPRPKSIALARNRAARLIAEWGHDHLADDTKVLVSELATNALRHAHVRGRLFRVRLTHTDSVLRIAVTDTRGECLPCVSEPPPHASHGRGLLIVRTLSARWGIHVLRVGKTVWCELELKRNFQVG